MITLENVSFSYNRQKTVFRQLHLALEPGRIYGLLGKNAAGKSTLLRLMSGLLFPTEGRCEVEGATAARRQPGFLSDVFLIPEEVWLPEISIKKYVDVHAPFYPKFDRAQFFGWLKEFQVPDHEKLHALSFGQRKKVLIAFGLAMLLISLKLTTVAVGFFAAALLVIVLGQISLKEAYLAIEGPVVVLLAALIPVAHSLQTTGVTDLLGGGLASAASGLPGFMALGMMLAAAMLLTPFLNNAAAVLVLGPVAGVVAKTLGYNADPFLMAVALGCACDFLTPVGHQNNLLVMGPGGYRFGDYWRLGLPLLGLFFVVAILLVPVIWPF